MRSAAACSRPTSACGEDHASAPTAFKTALPGESFSDGRSPGSGISRRTAHLDVAPQFLPFVPRHRNRGDLPAALAIVHPPCHRARLPLPCASRPGAPRLHQAGTHSAGSSFVSRLVGHGPVSDGVQPFSVSRRGVACFPRPLFQLAAAVGIAHRTVDILGSRSNGFGSWLSGYRRRCCFRRGSPVKWSCFGAHFRRNAGAGAWHDKNRSRSVYRRIFLIDCGNGNRRGRIHSSASTVTTFYNLARGEATEMSKVRWTVAPSSR